MPTANSTFSLPELSGVTVTVIVTANGDDASDPAEVRAMLDSVAGQIEDLLLGEDEEKRQPVGQTGQVSDRT